MEPPGPEDGTCLAKPIFFVTASLKPDCQLSQSENQVKRNSQEHRFTFRDDDEDTWNLVGPVYPLVTGELGASFGLTPTPQARVPSWPPGCL